jgi:histone H1/5
MKRAAPAAMTMAPRMQPAPRAAKVEAAAVKPVVVAKAAKEKPKAAPATTISHPKVSVMVVEAIKALRERKGSSLQAIKKYIAEFYKVDADKLARFIKDYLRSGTEKGELIQVTGTGATGSFRLPPKNPRAPAAPKVKMASPPKKAVAKKPAAAEKPKAPTKKAPAPTKMAKTAPVAQPKKQLRRQ